MAESTATLVVAGVLIAGAVYLATRKAAAPVKDDGPEAGGMCGGVAKEGDKAGGYGLLAGPACGIGEAIVDAIGYDPDSKPFGFIECIHKAQVDKIASRAEFCKQVTSGWISYSLCLKSQRPTATELRATQIRCAAENKIHLDGIVTRRTEDVIVHG